LLIDGLDAITPEATTPAVDDLKRKDEDGAMYSFTSFKDESSPALTFLTFFC